MSTNDSSEYCCGETEESEVERLLGSCQSLEEDLETSSKVLGIVDENRILLLHEETINCWCQPKVHQVDDYYIIVHNDKETSDA